MFDIVYSLGGLFTCLEVLVVHGKALLHDRCSCHCPTYFREIQLDWHCMSELDIFMPMHLRGVAGFCTVNLFGLVSWFGVGEIRRIPLCYFLASSLWEFSCGDRTLKLYVDFWQETHSCKVHLFRYSTRYRREIYFWNTKLYIGYQLNDAFATECM